MADDVLIRLCSPTLAGLKTGSLVNCAFDSREALWDKARTLNRRLARKGLRIMPLRYADGKGLLYIYRPQKLAQDLKKHDACAILRRCGYPGAYPGECPGTCLAELMRRLRCGGEFPHEIGLFLGYPSEDVLGFMENRECSKCTGVWRVYGDVAAAERTFERYRRCTKAYSRAYALGCSVDMLAVASN